VTVLRQLLLLPLLAPLLAVVVVGALNPKPAVRLRLLTYTSPSLPIGVWMMLAAAGGGLLSAGATGLALRSGSSPGRQRQVRLPLGGEPVWAEPSAWTSPASTEAPPSAPPRADHPQAVAVGPSRAPGEPPPTVEVPFRVIRRAASPVPAESPARDTDPTLDDWDDAGSDW